MPKTLGYCAIVDMRGDLPQVVHDVFNECLPRCRDLLEYGRHEMHVLAGLLNFVGSKTDGFKSADLFRVLVSEQSLEPRGRQCEVSRRISVQHSLAHQEIAGNTRLPMTIHA